MSIVMRPYAPELAVEVFRRLDPHDRLEAEAVRGIQPHFYELFGDWHAARAHHLVSVVLTRGARPFAVAALANTGTAGVAEAAFLAADHRAWRWAIARAAILIVPQLHRFCRESGIFRVEARSWAGHPSAPAFLGRFGFAHECDLPCIGPGGRSTFRLYALTFPNPETQSHV